MAGLLRKYSIFKNASEEPFTEAVDRDFTFALMPAKDPAAWLAVWEYRRLTQNNELKDDLARVLCEAAEYAKNAEALSDEGLLNACHTEEVEKRYVQLLDELGLE